MPDPLARFARALVVRTLARTPTEVRLAAWSIARARADCRGEGCEDAARLLVTLRPREDQPQDAGHVPGNHAP